MYKLIDFVVFAPVEFIKIYLFKGLVSDMFLLTQPKLVEEDWTLRASRDPDTFCYTVMRAIHYESLNSTLYYLTEAN